MENWTPPCGKEKSFIKGDVEGSALPVSERLQSPLVITGPDGKIMTWDTPQKKLVPWSATSKFNKSRVKKQLLRNSECDASSCSKPNPGIPSHFIIRRPECSTPQSSGKNGLLPTPQHHFWTPGRPPKTPRRPEYAATPITPPSKARPPMSSCGRPRSKSRMRLPMLDDQELQASRVLQARQDLLMERQERAFTAWLNHVFDLLPTGGSQVPTVEDSVSRKYSVTSFCSDSSLLSTDLQLIDEANCAKDFGASPFGGPSKSLRSPLAQLNGVGNRGFRRTGVGNMKSDKTALKDIFSTPDGKSSVELSPAGLHSSPKKLRMFAEHGYSYSRDAHMQDFCRISELARRLKLHFGQTDTGEILAVISQLSKHIDEGLLRMKKGCVILTDIALRKKALHVLLNYNACWTRIGLHAVFGHAALRGERLHQDGSNQTTHKDAQEAHIALLKVFIKRHFFAHSDLASESATYRTTEGLYRDEHSETLGRVILKRFFLFVLVLDKVKCQTALKITDGIDGVDGGSPPLFRSDASLKSSRQVLQEFLSGVMHGEGDLIENLGAFGYHVHHYQVPLVDYDFAVVNLIEDLRDGVRLCRLVQLLAKNDSRMLEHIQVPSNGRRQLHNCQVALEGLASAGVPLEDEDGRNINAEDIIEGNTDKVFSLLWNIMVHLQIPVLVSRASLCQEIAKLQGTEGRVALGLNVGTVELLLKWTQVTCMISGNFSVRNFKSSFGDGHAFFLILKLYLPHLLSGDAMLRPASPSQFEGQIGNTPDGKVSFSSTYKKIVAHNFGLVQDAARKLESIPEVLQLEDLLVYPEISERNIVIFIAFLCSFLLKDNAPVLNAQKQDRISQDADANHGVDELLRCGSQRKVESESLSAFNRFYSVPWPLHEAPCCTVSPEVYKSKTQWNENSLRTLSEDIVEKVCKIQAWWRARSIRPHVSSHQRTAQKIQIERHRVSAHSSALSLQAHWRGYVIRRMLKSRTAAATIIQLRYRALKNHRREQAAHVLQCCFRTWAQKRKYRATVSNMCKIQAFCWANQARGNFERERKAVHTIESEWLHYVARRRLQGSVQTQWQFSESALLIQAHWRGYFTRQILMRRSSGASVIQSWVRGHLQRTEYQRQKQRIQAHVQAWMQKENIRRRIQHTHVARIQACWRGQFVKRQFKEAVGAAKTIQREWRFLIALRERQLVDRAIKVKSSTRIQARWRGLVARRKLYPLKQAATKIQRAWRQFVVRSERRFAAKKIQREWRRFITLRKSLMVDSARQRILTEQTTGCIRIQARWLKHVARQQVEVQNHAARKIQRKWRHWIAWTRNRYVCALAIQGRGREQLDPAVDSTLEASVLARQSYQYSHLRRRRFQRVQEGLAIVIRTRHLAYLPRRIREVNVTSARIIEGWLRVQSRRRQFTIQRNSPKIFLCQTGIVDDGATRIQAIPPGVVERRRLGEQRKITSENQLVFLAREANTVSVPDQRALLNGLRPAVVFQTTTKKRLKLRDADHSYIVLVRIQSFCEVQQQCQQHEAVLLCQASEPESSTQVNFALEHEKMESGVCLERKEQADSANLHAYKESACSCDIIQSRYRGSTYACFLFMPTSPTVTIQTEVWKKGVIYVLQQLAPDGPSCAMTGLARTTCEIFHPEDCDSSCRPRFLAAARYLRRGHYARKNIGLKEEEHDTDRVDSLPRCLDAGNDFDQSSLACKKFSPKQLNAAHVILSWFQTFAQRANYLRLRSCVVVIQRHIRGLINRSRFAYIKASAILVQAHWRGNLVRRGQSQPQNLLRELRQKIRTNAVGVQDSARIYNRLAEALSTLPRQETVSGVLCTCRTIDVATQHSHNCCQQLAEDGAITTILLLIQTINRSPPFEQVLKHALSILSNVARYPPLATRVAQSPSAIRIISEHLNTFRNDEGIFLQAVYVLQLVCNTSAGMEVLQRERSVVRRLLLIAQSLEGNIQAEKRTVETLPWTTPAAMQRKSAHTKMREVLYKFLSTVGLTNDVSGLLHYRTMTSTTPLRRQHTESAPAQSVRLIAHTCLNAKRVLHPKLATTARQALSPRNGRSFSQ